MPFHRPRRRNYHSTSRHRRTGRRHRTPGRWCPPTRRPAATRGLTQRNHNPPDNRNRNHPDSCMGFHTGPAATSGGKPPAQDDGCCRKTAKPCLSSAPPIATLLYVQQHRCSWRKTRPDRQRPHGNSHPLHDLRLPPRQRLHQLAAPRPEEQIPQPPTQLERVASCRDGRLPQAKGFPAHSGSYTDS